MEGDTVEPVLRTVVIGSGNVASALAPALEQAGAIIVEAVYSRTKAHAETLAGQLGRAVAVDRIEDVPADADLYLMAVKDDAIAELAGQFKSNDALWLHTSGGVPAVTLSRLSANYGVFYPLQTFSRGVAVDLPAVPVFVEASNGQSLEKIKRMAHAISPKVYEADGDKRCRLHAAAVFACNFTNHLWAMADDVLRRETGTDLTVLAPLLHETLRKALAVRPGSVQTGPAVRGDCGVMAKHASLLADDEADMYRYISAHIMKYYNIDNELD